jgi:hypothetical protein
VAAVLLKRDMSTGILRAPETDVPPGAAAAAAGVISPRAIRERFCWIRFVTLSSARL